MRQGGEWVQGRGELTERMGPRLAWALQSDAAPVTFDNGLYELARKRG